MKNQFSNKKTWYRFVLYKDNKQLHLIDLANENFDSIGNNGATETDFFICNNKLYSTSSFIDQEESTPDDITFTSAESCLGSIIYQTNDFQEIASLMDLHLQRENKWNKFKKFYWEQYHSYQKKGE